MLEPELTIGEILLMQHQDMQDRLRAGGDEAFVSLIAACMNAHIDNFRIMNERISQIAGHDCSGRLFLALMGESSFEEHQFPWYSDGEGTLFIPEDEIDGFEAMSHWQPAGAAS